MLFRPEQKFQIKTGVHCLSVGSKAIKPECRKTTTTELNQLFSLKKETKMNPLSAKLSLSPSLYRTNERIKMGFADGITAIINSKHTDSQGPLIQHKGTRGYYRYNGVTWSVRLAAGY